MAVPLSYVRMGLTLMILSNVFLNFCAAQNSTTNCTSLKAKNGSVLPPYNLCSDDDRDTDLTHPLQKDDDLSALTNSTQWYRRNKLENIIAFANYASSPDPYEHGLQNWNTPCDPDLHKKWMKVKDIESFLSTKNESLEWFGKICNFFRLLDCNSSTRTCQCVSNATYGVDVQKNPEVNDTNSDFFGPNQCIAKEFGLCFFYLEPGTWPGIDFRIATLLNCPVPRDDANAKNGIAVCKIFEEPYPENKTVYSQRCYPITYEKPKGKSSSVSLFESYSVFMSFIVGSIMMTLQACKVL